VKVTLTVVGTVQALPDAGRRSHSVRDRAADRRRPHRGPGHHRRIGRPRLLLVQLRAGRPAPPRSAGPGHRAHGTGRGLAGVEGQNVSLDIRAQALEHAAGRRHQQRRASRGAGGHRLGHVPREHGRRPAGVLQGDRCARGRPTVQASLPNGYLKATRSETLLGEGTVLTMDMALRPTGTVEGPSPSPTARRRPWPWCRCGSWARAAATSRGPRPIRTGRVRARRFRQGVDLRRRAGQHRSCRRRHRRARGATLTVPLRLNGVGSLRGIARLGRRAHGRRVVGAGLRPYRTRWR
jgi:hypothetical protein